ncbi:MAG: LysR family transcriptional regulator [Pigmentiphaga sp.]
MLDLNRLQLLHQLSILGTVGRVAEARELTRPAVSHQLARLEEDVGTVLFERSGRGVKLTSAGLQLVARSKELLSLAERIEAEMEALSSEIAGELRIAAFGSAASGLVPGMLRLLQNRHPRVDVHTVEMESDEGMQAAAAKRVDLAVVYDPPEAFSPPESLQMLPLCKDRFVAVLPAGHRYAGRSHLSLAELSQERWDMNTASRGYHSLLMRACQEHGFEPRVRSSCRNPAASLELIRTGALVAVFPALVMMAARHDPDFAIIPLTPPLERTIFVATVRESSRRPVVAAAITALRESSSVLPRTGNRPGSAVKQRT